MAVKLGVDLTVGYGFCPSGLNNQKYALLGLICFAKRSSAGIALPALVNFATDTRGFISQVALEEIFDVDEVCRLANEFGVEVRRGEIVDNLNFHDMFKLGNKVLRSANESDRALSKAFWERLRPAAVLGRQIEELADNLFHQRGVRVVVQMRVEPDWVTYISKVGGEDWETSYRDILCKVSRRFGSALEIVYLTCDETQVPRVEIERFARNELDLSLVWKSDLPALNVAQDELCKRTMIDFELAVKTPIFVGTTRSTFANVACIVRSARSNAVTEDYVYNAPTETVERRTDGGLQSDYRAALSAVQGQP